MASFCRIDSESSRLPTTLSALEEQNFLFQLQLQDKAEEDSSEVLMASLSFPLFNELLSLRSKSLSDY